MYPVVLIIVDIGAEILFQCHVSTLRLTVSFWVKSCGEYRIGSDVAAQSLPKESYELGSSIGYNGGWESAACSCGPYKDYGVLIHSCFLKSECKFIRLRKSDLGPSKEVLIFEFGDVGESSFSLIALVPGFVGRGIHVGDEEYVYA